MTTIAVILPAAGSSRRFGGLQKKTLTTLHGKPVWYRTAELFWSRPDVAKVYLVIHPEDRDDLLRSHGAALGFAEAELVDGGAERFESVANALARVPAQVELVAIHDAVRPLVTPTLIQAVFDQARRTGAALLAVPVADTLKEVDETTHQVRGTRSRAGLWQAQTPQVFRRELLVEAYARRHELTVPITDDAQLVEAFGHPVSVVRSSAMNLKITIPEDFVLAETILCGRESQTRDSELNRRPGTRSHSEDEW